MAPFLYNGHSDSNRRRCIRSPISVNAPVQMCKPTAAGEGWQPVVTGKSEGVLRML